MASSRTPAAPKTLSAASKKLWGSILKDFAIDDAAGLKILEQGLLALDRAESCRKKINATGELVEDRFGQDKPNPLLPSERDARSQFLLALKSLKLDLDPLPGRPTR